MRARLSSTARKIENVAALLSHVFGLLLAMGTASNRGLPTSGGSRTTVGGRRRRLKEVVQVQLRERVTGARGVNRASQSKRPGTPAVQSASELLSEVVDHLPSLRAVHPI